MAEYFSVDLAMGCNTFFSNYNVNRINYLRKDPKLALKETRDQLEKTFIVGSSKLTDEFICRFLLARKYNVDETIQLISNYFNFRKRNPDLFRRLNAHEVLIQQALRDGFPSVLKSRDRKGRQILICLASRWNTRLYSLITIYRALLLSLDHLIADELNQRRGFVIVIDWSEFSFKQSFHLNPKIIKVMIEGLQDNFPARFKGIHFIGQPWYVETVLAIIKPFLKEKSKNKIHLHGNNLSTLYEYVSVDVLPAELGGDGPALEPQIWLQTLLDAPIDNLPILPDDELLPYEPDTAI